MDPFSRALNDSALENQTVTAQAFSKARHKLRPSVLAAPCASDDDTHWRASIHMPRRASRITLEITDIRL